MPPVQTDVRTSELWAKLGKEQAAEVQKAHDVAKATPARLGNPEMPAGVNGIAKLRDIRIGEYKEGKYKGKLFFMASALCVYPEFADNGLPIKNVATKIGPEPLCDTDRVDKQGNKIGFAQQYEKLLNVLKVCGANTANTTWQQIPSLIAQLMKIRPYIRFNTRKGQKQTTGKYAGQEPRIWHEWNGVVKWEDKSTTPGSGVQDNSAPVSSANGQGATTQVGSSAPTKVATPTRTVPHTTPTPTPDFDEFGDLDSLVHRANNKDAKAQRELQQYGRNAGMTEEEVNDPSVTWEALAQAILDRGDYDPISDASNEDVGVVDDDDAEAQAGENGEVVAENGGEGETFEQQEEESEYAEEEPEPEPEPWKPEVGKMCLYRPLGKDKKRVDKPIETEVIEFNEGKGRLKLRNPANNQVSSNVPLDAVSQIQ